MSRIKRIKGKEYWYEDTPYYDLKTKQIQHKSRYLGKNIDGKPVKVRTETAGTSIASVPTHAYSYGPFLPLLAITKDLHLDEYLLLLTRYSETNVILALSMSRVMQPRAMHLVSSWYKDTSLFLTNSDLPLSSQRISELLFEIGESGVPDAFMTSLLRGIGTDSTLIYDVTCPVTPLSFRSLNTAIIETVAICRRSTSHSSSTPSTRFRSCTISIPAALTIQDIHVSGFCYYDLKREQTERNLFYIRLHDLKVKLESSRTPWWRRPEELFKERAGKMVNYFSWQVVDNRFQVEIRKNAVS